MHFPRLSALLVAAFSAASLGTAAGLPIAIPSKRKPPVRAHQGSVVVELNTEGGLDRSAVKLSLEGNTAGLLDCAGEGEQVPNARLEFSILATGDAVGVHVSGVPTEVGACIERQLKSVRFDRSGRSTVVAMTLMMSKVDDSKVGPPSALDLARYTRDLPGRGPLQTTFHTTSGNIRCQLYENKAPLAVANFVGLARGRKAFKDPRNQLSRRAPYYDGIIFHRVIPNFIIQAGDPTGTGSGGPGYSFSNETSDRKHDRPGVLSMANAGRGTNGSQFFITEKATPWLDGKHTIFGQCKDLRVIKKIARVKTRSSNKPARDVIIRRVSFARHR